MPKSESKVTTSRRERASASDDRSRERVDAPSLLPTKNSVPEHVRAQVVPLINQRLAECVDLQTQCKQAHRNVKGPSFIGLHELFDEINEAVEVHVDLMIAERVVQLGGVAEGTARMGIEEMDELEDDDGADILTEISRGVDRWLWCVDAQQLGEPITGSRR